MQVAWGLLPLGLPLAIVLILGMGALTLPHADGFERLLAGGLLTTALIVVIVALLGALGVLTTPVLAATLVVSAVAVVLAVRARQPPWRLPWRLAVSRETAPLLLVAATGIVLVGSGRFAAYGSTVPAPSVGESRPVGAACAVDSNRRATWSGVRSG